ncbi:MAG: sulfurtransferase [Desulfobacterales bacterium]|nr:sulfurtransferase [Desulfobacterales bacterium]
MKLRKLTALLLCAGLIVTAGFGCATTQSAAPEAALSEVVEEAKAVADNSWMFHDIVDVEFVMQHMTIPMSENIMIIDARPKQAKYDMGHIPMAVSIPDTYFDKNIDKLPADKNALLIYYCQGLKCKLSHKSAYKAEALGYSNVKVFAEGYPKWLSVKGNYGSVSVEWVKKQIDQNTEMTLVDSRPKEMKYDKGHIPTAISISDTMFDKHIDLLPENKNELLIFYCGGFHCRLSHKSAAKAIALGYSNVKVFAAGYPAWKEIAASTTPVNAGKEEGSIDLASFKKIIDENPESVYLIDVRDADEFANGSFKTATNIPVDTLEAKISELPTDKPIIFVCGTGARSGESYYMVQDVRPELKDVFYLEAELTISKDGSYTIKPSP